MINIPLQNRLKLAALLLIILLATALLYTTLHEGGHALVGLAFGARITDFNVNFFNLGAHVGIDGHFTTTQSAIFNAAGVLLPIIVWFLTMISLPKKNDTILQWIKIVSTMGFLNTLLAWVIVPFLYLANSAPPSDDITKFISNSGFPPLVVAMGACGLYAVGWTLFAFRIGNLREAFKTLGAPTMPLPAWKKILVIVVVIAVIAGGAAVGVSIAGVHDPSAPPPEYALASTLSFSERDYQAETVASFTLSKPGDASIFLRVERLNTPLIDVNLISSQGETIQLLHGKDFSTDVSSSQAQYRLPAGEHKIVLTCLKSAGILKIYFRLP